MARKSERPPVAGASLGKKVIPTSSDQGVKVGFVTMVKFDFAARGATSAIARRTTIEDRLNAKATEADGRDRTGRRSLDQMPDDEISERL